MAAKMPLILTDVKALATAKAATWTFSNKEMKLTIIVKKKMIVLAEDAKSPLLIIVGRRTRPGDEAFEGILNREHEVLFALLFANEGNFGDVERMNDKLEDLQKVLHVTSLATATTVWNSDLDTTATFDVRGIPAGWDYSLFKVVYKSSEARN